MFYIIGRVFKFIDHYFILKDPWTKNWSSRSYSANAFISKHPRGFILPLSYLCGIFQTFTSTSKGNEENVPNHFNINTHIIFVCCVHYYQIYLITQFHVQYHNLRNYNLYSLWFYREKGMS